MTSFKELLKLKVRRVQGPKNIAKQTRPSPMPLAWQMHLVHMRKQMLDEISNKGIEIQSYPALRSYPISWYVM